MSVTQVLVVSTVVVLSGLMASSQESDSTADSKPAVAPELKPFEPLLGRTYTAEFPTKDGKPPASDVQKWERILNGKGVRLVHSVNRGSYGGETIFMYDKSREVITYHYFTTAGFMTVGTVRFNGDEFSTNEKVKGEGTRVTEVTSTTVVEQNGDLVVTTKMLRDGKWTDRGTVTYKETPMASVVFK